jgi:protein-L-isoaspartate O-methyltransferase
MRKTRSLDADYFEGLYRADPDPWKFQSSAYEARKYADTLAVIGERPVGRAFEMGCSIGVLTRQLAELCEHLVATELSQAALDQARRRCADRTNVEFALAKAMTDGIDGAFDLMLLSEVVYYWDDTDLAQIAAAVCDHLAAEGRLVLVHWLGQTDYPRSADDAVDALFGRIGDRFEITLARRTDDYRMDVWTRRPS